jgi:hypothetical protein
MPRRIALSALVLALPLLLAARGTTEDLTVDELWEFSPGPEGIMLEKLIAIVQEDTGESVVYNPQDVLVKNKRLFFPGSYRVPRSRVFDWFRSMLSYQKLVLVPAGPEGHRQWLLMSINDPAACSRPVYVDAKDLPEWKDRDGAYIVTVLEFEKLADTTRARNALANLLTRPCGRLNDVPGGRSIIVGDFAPVVHAMSKLVQAMDVAPAPAAAPAGRPAANPQAVRPPARAPTQTALERYETLLVGCRTDAAAGYFLERIRELRQAGK